MSRCTPIQAGPCPLCREGRYTGLGWRVRLAEHFHRAHNLQIFGELRDFLEDAFESIELRSTQRALLLFAIDCPQFRVESGGDSTSLWSMERRGWFLVSLDSQVRSRVWRLTTLGHEIARAALARSRKLGERVRHPYGVFAVRGGRHRNAVRYEPAREPSQKEIRL